MTQGKRKRKERPELSQDELESQSGEPLPKREAMSLIDPGGTTAPIPIGGDLDAPPNPDPKWIKGRL